MKLKKLTASFGRLNGERLVPGPGLTVIEAPNEGGKSTWSAFYRTMLYGIDTRDRDKKGHLADKNRFQPWSGRPMEGEIELVWRGQEITLRRGPRGGTPFGRFEAVYTATGEAVPGLTGERAGELLTGVNREVFERSAFVGQGGVALTPSGDLERRIAALATSGEEDVSAVVVQRRLKEWWNRRRANRANGIIPRLEEELSRTEALLERQGAARRRAEAAQAAVDRLEEEHALLECEMGVWRARAYQEAAQRRRRAEEEWTQAKTERDRVADELERYGAPPENEALRKAQSELSYLGTLDSQLRRVQDDLPGLRRAMEEARAQAGDPVFEGQEPEEARERARRDCERASQPPAWRPPAALWLVLAAAAAAAVACGIFVSNAAAAGAAAAGAILVLALGLGFRHSAMSRWQREQAALLKRYGVNTAEEIHRRGEDYTRRWERARSAEEACRRQSEEARRLDIERTARWAELLDLVHSFAPEVRDAFGVSAAISKIFALRDALVRADARLSAAQSLLEGVPEPSGAAESPGAATPRYEPAETGRRLAGAVEKLSQARQELAMALGEQNTLGDPDALQVRREELAGRIEERSRELQAIAVAMEALEQADHAMRERFSPALNHLAESYFARLTGGRYESLSLDRDFEASAREQGGLLPHRALSLSAGTVDQIYLAVRLAVCQLALPEQDPCPLILDDALANFDDDRCAMALDCLAELARERQILLFTCHRREGAYLADRPDVMVLPLHSEGKRAIID